MTNEDPVADDRITPMPDSGPYCEHYSDGNCRKCATELLFPADWQPTPQALEDLPDPLKRYIKALQPDEPPRRVVILELPPQTVPVRFKLYAPIYDHEKDLPDLPESNRFFYEEHTCPTNWLGQVDEIYFDDEPDVHGFRFIELRDMTEYEIEMDERGTGPVPLDGKRP